MDGPDRGATSMGKGGLRAVTLRRVIARRRDLALAAGAAAWLLLAWLLLDMLPNRRYWKLLHPSVRRPELGEDLAQRCIQRVAWAVTAVARRVPWRAVCFHQGIAAQQMLCRAGVPAELHFGVAKSAGKGMEAHVWVTAKGRTVVGGKAQARFTELASFAGLNDA